ncbi:MAG: sel1 repeat family protein [Bacteroidetes bacterium]|nr:sel1 repeat family protein [Bacteroidota bacterium]
MKKILLLILLAANLINAQDSTLSKAFKSTQPKSMYPLIKAKYPSYQLLTGFLLLKEANGGDPYAQHELSLRYLLGKGFLPDTAQAVYWIKKAVEQNLPFAKFNYAIMLNNAIGVSWNPFKAFEYFKSSAVSGMPSGQYAYGIFLTDNLVVNRNYYEAYRWIKKASEGGFEYAKDALDQFKKAGFTFALDSAETDKNTAYLNSSGKAELMDQNWELDFFDFENDSLSEEEEIKAVKEVLNQNTDKLKETLGISDIINKAGLKDTTASELIKFAAKSGSPEALLIAGRGYEKGIVVKKNIISAAVNYLRSLRLGSQKALENLYNLVRTDGFFDILQKETDAHNPDAMYAWAGLVALGIDYRITSEQAFDLLKKAVSLGHVQAIVETGLCYYNGDLVEHDKKKAMEYWSEAALKGSIEAKVRIAFSEISEYAEGKDVSNEIKTFMESSESGSVLAQSALAYCYEKGIGVKTDKPKAVELYRKSAQRGNMASYNSLKRMYDEIRPAGDEFIIFED